MVDEAALLVLHHDDGVAVGGNAVGAAGTGETGGGLQVVALAENAGGVHVAVRVDLRAADEGDETILVVQPLVGLEADEADVGPLHGAVRHEAVVADGAGDLNGVAVHQTRLDDGVAAGADRALGKGRTDQRKTRTDDDDLVFLNILSNGIRLHFLFCVLRIIRHFNTPPNLVRRGIAEVRLVLQAHQTAAAELIEQSGLIFAAVDPLFKEILDVDIELPIQRMTWQEAMDRFGSDKPDLRFGMELKNVTDVVKNCGFGVFTGAIENGGSVRGINVKGQGAMPRKKIDALVDFAKGYGAKGLAYIAIHEDGTVKSSFAKFMTEEEMQSLIKAMDGENGDLLLFAADKNKIVWNVLGALRVELADQLGLLDKNEFRFLWVTEFPQFEWSDEENRFVAMHHPFTMPMDEDLDMLETNPGAVRAKAYDIVLNGTEIGGGSVRIHQADVQQRMFNALGFTNEAAYEKFGFLLDAFKYGVPPHAGLAYGLDRLVMIMAKRDSIRDVIAFPKVKDASCLLTNAPDVVDEKQLRELSINIDVEEDDK